MSEAPGSPEVTVYEFVGGEPTFRALVDAFYEGVMEDPLLAPLYPKEDLAGARDRLSLFLMQYWGGPDTYSQQRGHPRLRMRHLPYRIGWAERDAWVEKMAAAVDAVGIPEPARKMMLDYFGSTATFMVNQLPDHGDSHPGLQVRSDPPAF